MCFILSLPWTNLSRTDQEHSINLNFLVLIRKIRLWNNNAVNKIRILLRQNNKAKRTKHRRQDI